MWRFLRYFDLEYWQMREALGYSIPAWVDRRWPRKLQGNAGKNPYWPHPYIKGLTEKSEAARVELTQQAQELDMGY
jgi:hypothetical protein